MTKVLLRKITVVVIIVSGFIVHSILLVSVTIRNSCLSNTLKSSDGFQSKVKDTGAEFYVSSNSTNFNKNKTNPSTINCTEVFLGNHEEICRWKDFTELQPSDAELFKEFQNCERLKEERGYPQNANSIEEEIFPLAFAISVHRDVYQLERLLRLIYWPQNFYCIHVDKKSPNETQEAARALADCFPNVFLTKSEYVYWAGFGVLQAVLNCAEDLLKISNKWKYFINIGAQDFPLKTNLELVKILQIFNGSNDVEMKREVQFKKFWFSHVLLKDKQGIPVTHVPDFRRSKLPVPRGLRIYKGNLAASLSRSFVNFLLTDSRSLELMEWLKDTDTADEHLWSTINHNEMLEAPGGFSGLCYQKYPTKGWVSRYVKWRQNNSVCGGKYVRDVCVLGLEDLAELPKRPEFFVNKLYTDYQSKAYKCLEDWHREKVRRKTVEIQPSFYENLEGVQYHKTKVCPVPDMQNQRSINSITEEINVKDYIKSGIDMI